MNWDLWSTTKQPLCFSELAVAKCNEKLAFNPKQAGVLQDPQIICLSALAIHKHRFINRLVNPAKRDGFAQKYSNPTGKNQESSLVLW